MLNLLTGAINSITETVRGMDPATLQGISTGIAGLTVALAGGGGAAILAAMGPAGWLTGGIIALGAALVALDKAGGLKFFDDIEKAVQDLGARLSAAIVNMLRGILPSWMGGAPATPGATPGSGVGPPSQWSPVAPPFMPMRYTPGAGGSGFQNAIHTGGQGGRGAGMVNLSLNIDGHKIAEAMSSALADFLQFPESSTVSRFLWWVGPSR